MTGGYFRDSRYFTGYHVFPPCFSTVKVFVHHRVYVTFAVHPCNQPVVVILPAYVPGDAVNENRFGLGFGNLGVRTGMPAYKYP